MIRVLVVDDQELVRSGLRMILDRHDDLTIVGEAADGRRGVELATTARPDVILMDIRMPVLDGVAATAEILAGADPPRVIVLTTFDTDELVFAALRAGASGFLLKDSRGEQIVEAIRAVAAGHAMLDPAVTRRVIDDLSSPAGSRRPPPEWDLLSSREQEVLRALARGASNQEIAAELYLSEATIKSHISQILAKLQLRDRTQAVVWAFHAGVA